MSFSPYSVPSSVFAVGGSGRLASKVVFASYPWTKKKGENLVDFCGALLYAWTMKGRSSSQSVLWWFTYLLSESAMVR